ncbi:MAG TPA: M15 family metallopeptidase [Thermoanaerobaculia bacterium]|nr:M15 family metallopeptidase [Thermoanaerobaculia bacterium]
MQRSFNLTLLALLLACATAPRIPANRYGLQVVPDVATYERLVAADPDTRLVDVANFIPGVVLDIRYATTNNFMHQQLYPVAKAYLRYPAAVALRDVQDELAKDGIGLKIFDAYRPYSITEKMWEPIKNPDFVADPSKGSRHNRGAAVDLTLIDRKTGKELTMPSAYDEFSPRARLDYFDATEPTLRNRDKLRETMTRHGFEPLRSEWWHYDFRGWERFELMDVPLQALGKPLRKSSS